MTLLVVFRSGLPSSRHDQRSQGLRLLAPRFTAPELRARIADPSLGGPYRVDSIGKILIEDWLASHA